MHAFTIFAMVILSLLSIASQAEAGNFLATCRQQQIAPRMILMALCTTTDGTAEYSGLDLGKCLLNNNGYLGWLPNGKANASCMECKTVGKLDNILSCLCRQKDKHLWVRSTINLNDGVKNDNGVLKCDWM